MDYESFKATRDKLESEVAAVEAVLARFPSGTMGLTPDSVKTSEAFRDAKRAFNLAFSRLRAYNARYLGRFKREAAAERAARKPGS
jgi:hypothetical protein